MEKAKSKGTAKKKISKQGLFALLINFWQNTDFTNGTPGMNEVYFAPRNIFAPGGIPDPPPPGASAGVSFIAGSGGFSFVGGQGFIAMKNDLLKGGEMEWKSVGDAAGPGTEGMLKGRTLGMTPQLLEQFNLMIGLPGVWLVKDTNTPAGTPNTYWVLGTYENPAFFTFDFKTGTKGGNEPKGCSWEVKSPTNPYSIVLTYSALQALLLPD